MKKIMKVLSVMLAVIFCLQTVTPGINVFAENITSEEIQAQSSTGSTVKDIDIANPKETPIVGEITDLRDENTKHFRHKDGTFTAAVYSEPVHYETSDGEWKDIDNTLVLNNNKKNDAGKATYTPKASGLDVRIPQDFSSSQKLTITKNGYTVGMGIKSSANSSQITESTLSSVKAQIDNNFESVSPVETTDTSRTVATTVEAQNAEKMKLDNKVSAVNYDNLIDGADLQYVISSGKVKENIILNSAKTSYVYQFELDFDGLTPVQQPNGSIELFENIDDEKALFTIEAPYMYDANDETSFDVSMVLKGNVLTVVANPEWINADERKFPIVIDPTFSVTSNTGFYDATVQHSTPTMNFDTYKYLYAGNGFLNLRRTYMKFDLPVLPEGSVVTNAELKIMQKDVDLADTSKHIYAFDLSNKNSWNESAITWNNQPISTEINGPHEDASLKKIDYQSFITEDDGGQIYTFNLTKVVRNWYEGSANNGIMLSNNDEDENSQTTLYSSNHSNSSYHPAVKIEYNNSIGIEEQWTYETMNLGRSGVIYANPYNGSVTYIHNDLSMHGNRLPINISHVYNSNADDIYITKYSGMYVGKKYHLNIQEIVIPIQSSDSMYGLGYRYKHYDEDGTIHYYIQNGSTITHEYNPTLIITKSGAEYILSDVENNKKYFNSKGQLYKIEDKNGNVQSFTFTGNQITKITDPVGREVTLSYNEYGLLNKITDTAGRIIKISYNGRDSSAQPSKITYPDQKFTVFVYSLYAGETRNEILCYDYCTVTLKFDKVDIRGERLQYLHRTYEDCTSYEMNFQYTETLGNKIVSGKTIVSNDRGDSVEYLFDDYGRAISATNQYGQTQYSSFGSNAVDSSETFNKILDSSNSKVIASNILYDSGFEIQNYWYRGASSQGGFGDYTTEMSLNGTYSAKLVSTCDFDVGNIRQEFDSVSGETYTLSADIYIPQDLTTSRGGGVYIGIDYKHNGEYKHEHGSYILSTDGWERISETVTIPEGTIEYESVIIEIENATGTVYVDNVQLEKGGTAHQYNLVNTLGFSKGTSSSLYGWDTSGTQSGDKFMQNQGFVMSGSTEHSKRIYQTVQVNAKAGESLVIGGKAKASATTGKNDGRYFDICAELYDSNNNLIETVTIDFDRKINNESQAVAAYVPLKSDCKYLIYSFRYYKHMDSATFEGAFVYVGDYGNHYRYEEQSGLLNSIFDDNDSSVSVGYNADNKISTLSQSAVNSEQINSQVTYDANGVNIIKIVNDDGSEINYTYNTTGQITTQTITKGSLLQSTETAEYTEDGNYLKKFTDSNGAVTTYEYDNGSENRQKGLVTSITDPKNNTTTYTYDQNTDELLTVNGGTDASSPPIVVGFTYEDYLTKTITRNGTVYSYEYDSLGRVVSSKIGSQTLVTNEYDDELRLVEQTYANGTTYTPVYNDKDFIIGEQWNDTLISEYSYYENDILSQFTDHITDTTYQYDYGPSGGLFKVTGSDGTKTESFYDSTGGLEGWQYTLNNTALHTLETIKNDKGYINSATIKVPSGQDNISQISIQYNYDELDRLSERFIGPIKNTITYLDSDDTYGYNGSGSIGEFKFLKENVELKKYTYTYDIVGNIVGITDGTSPSNITNISYVYDGLNRLVSETIGNDTYTYSYDEGGNITSVVKNGVTIKTYSYTDSEWKDKLTSVDGNSLTYDSVGNPLTYNGYTFQWQRNKLSSFSGNGLNVSYTYDANGKRIQQVVNGETYDYLYSGDLLIRQTNGTNTLDFQYDSTGTAVSFKYNGVLYYYIRNIQGDVTAITDSTGTIVAEYQYDAWGNILSYTGAMASINPIRYRGYYQDPETGWYYLNSRYYNPEWRRFLNADSLFIAGDVINGSNMFAYCNNNPVMYVDALGLAARANSASESVAVSVTRIVCYLYYIAKYATNNGKNINAIVDFLNRTTDEDSTLSDVAYALEIGVGVLNSNRVWLYTDKVGTFIDMLQIAGKSIPGIVGESATALTLFTDIMADRYNPFMFDEDVSENLLIHVIDIAGGTGIATFSVEFGAAITAATGGNIIFGGFCGAAVYLAGTLVWDGVMNG